MSDPTPSSLRCGAPTPASAIYCPSCGVSVSVAATGEHPLVDFERFFNYGVDLMCVAGN